MNRNKFIAISLIVIYSLTVKGIVYCDVPTLPPLLIPPPSHKQEKSIAEIKKNPDAAKKNKYSSSVETSAPAHATLPAINTTTQTATLVAEEPKVAKITAAELSKLAETKIMIGIHSSSDNMYGAIAGSICLLMNEKYSNTCFVKNYQNSLDATKSMLNGDIDFVTGNTTLLSLIKNDKLRTVGALYEEKLAIIAMDKLGLKTFDDTTGYVVNFDEQKSTTKSVMDDMMNFKRWNSSSFKGIMELPQEKAVQALCNGTIDVMVTVAGYHNKTIKNVTRLCETDILSVNKNDIDAFTASHNQYKEAAIIGGMYLGNPIDISTIAINSLIFTTTDIDNIKVYKLAQTIFSNIEQIAQLNAVLQNFSKENILSAGKILPLHNGVNQYLETFNKNSNKN